LESGYWNPISSSGFDKPADYGCGFSREKNMNNTTIIAGAAALLLAATTGFSPALAQGKPTNPKNLPPGQLYQDREKKSVKGTHGASGYTPGYQMRQDMKPPRGNQDMPGASGFAPGHAPSRK
jgi:hypothetical protein